MGKVIAPLHSIQVRGKVGGVLFRRWRNINTVSGPGGNTDLTQNTYVVAFRAAMNSWRTLTSAQILAWRKYADGLRTGGGILKPTHRSGYMTYVLAAYLADQCGEAWPTDPPESAPPNFLRVFTLENDNFGGLTVWWGGGHTPEYVQIKAYVNKSLGRRIYDLQLADFGMTESTEEEIRLDDWETGTYSRAGGRLVRANGQAGPWSYAELYS